MNPFEVLGLSMTADADQVRAAYRKLVKQHHPDQFQDPEEKQQAHERMMAINAAYEQALRYAIPRQTTAYSKSIPLDEALQLAQKMLKQGRPEMVLRELKRSETHSGPWFFLEGQAWMLL